MLQGHSDYDFHGYGELCNFVYCLLLKTKDIADLSGLMEWEECMDVSRITALPNASMVTFLMSCDYGKRLSAGETIEVMNFRVLCRDFMNRLAVLTVESVCVKSGVSRCLHSFCPEIMLEGEDYTIFGRFLDFCKLLVFCGVVTCDESKAAIEDYTSYIVEKRRPHSAADRASSDIPDVMSFLLRTFINQNNACL